MLCILQRIISLQKAYLSGSVRYMSDWQEVAGSTPPVWQQSFVWIDLEIFSTVSLSLPLIQQEQLSVPVEECAQYWLTA